jgi:hypothetical protein
LWCFCRKSLAWYFCERIAANWYNNKHLKLFLFLFGPVNLHSDSWILQLKKRNKNFSGSFQPFVRKKFVIFVHFKGFNISQ